MEQPVSACRQGSSRPLPLWVALALAHCGTVARVLCPPACLPAAAGTPTAWHWLTQRTQSGATEPSSSRGAVQCDRCVRSMLQGQRTVAAPAAHSRSTLCCLPASCGVGAGALAPHRLLISSSAPAPPVPDAQVGAGARLLPAEVPVGFPGEPHRSLLRVRVPRRRVRCVESRGRGGWRCWLPARASKSLLALTHRCRRRCAWRCNRPPFGCACPCIPLQGPVVPRVRKRELGVCSQRGPRAAPAALRRRRRCCRRLPGPPSYPPLPPSPPPQGLMRKRVASINEAPIAADQRRVALPDGNPPLHNAWLAEQACGLGGG